MSGSVTGPLSGQGKHGGVRAVMTGQVGVDSEAQGRFPDFFERTMFVAEVVGGQVSAIGLLRAVLSTIDQTEFLKGPGGET